MNVAKAFWIVFLVMGGFDTITEHLVFKTNAPPPFGQNGASWFEKQFLLQFLIRPQKNSGS